MKRTLLLALLCTVCICIHADATLVERNAALRAAVQEAILSAKDIRKEPIITSASQMSSPCSQNDLSSILDGGNLWDGVLIDNNLDTYWHSVWSEGSVPTGSHYIQISGTEQLQGNAQLYIARRRAENNHLTELTLRGSNSPDASDSKWKTITVQQIGNVTSGAEWTTPIFQAGSTPYSYIRVYATRSTFWHCSELQIYRLAEGENSYFSQLGQVAVDLETVYEQNCAIADSRLTEAHYAALKSAYQAFRAKAQEMGYWADESRLVVNEIQVSNIDQFLDPSCNYGSWVEFYNPTHAQMFLAGTYLSDDRDDPRKFALPATVARIAPEGHATLWFGHNSAQGNYGEGAQNQVPFNLDAEGDTLYLFDAEGHLLLSQAYPAGVSRCSWARVSDGGEEWGMCSTPTPGQSNAGSRFAQQRLPAPVVDTDGTVFTTPFKVRVTIPSGATLRFTTDGSTPTLTHGTTSLSGVFDVSHTRIFRFCLFRDGYLPSPVVTRSYIYGNHNYYLPVISIATHPDNLYDSTIGVYTQGTNGISGNGRSDACNWNMDWERPVNLEYMTPEGGQFVTRINQEADFEICGGWSRAYGGGTVDGKYWPMKSSFRVKSDKRYEGCNSLDYPVFPHKPHNRYRVWQVRNGGNDTYSRITDAALAQMVIQSHFYIDAQDCQPAHVFFNGEYLGMLNIRESNNRHYGYSNYGIDTDEMDQFDLSNARYNQKVGDDVAWKELVALSRTLATDHSPSTWERVCALLDIDEYCNYMAFQCYVGNMDWITNVNNVKAFRSRTDDGKFHFVLFDDDSAFGTTSMTTRLLQSDYPADVDDLFRNLMQYAPFRSQFVTAFCIVNGSVLDPDASAAIVQEIYDRTHVALGFEGNASSTGLASTIRSAHDSRRMSNLRTTLSLGAPYQLTVSSNVPQARLSLNGQEIPRGRLSGQVFPPVTLTAKAPAGYMFRGWSLAGAASAEDLPATMLSQSETFSLSDEHKAGTYVLTAIYEPVTDARLQLEQGATPIRVNEVSAANDIHINDYGKRKDWVELYNTTDTPIDLAGMYLSDQGSKPQKYQISAHGSQASTVVPAHGRVIVWCDGEQPLNQLHAPFKLDNADGATVTLQAQDGAWADRMDYLAQERWQTYGRYPDGGVFQGILVQPTIGQPNLLGTYDYITQGAAGWTDDAMAITLDLEKGWNWTSHNLSQAVDQSRFTAYAQCIRGETSQLVLGEDGTWQGSLSAMAPAAGYKVDMSQDASVSLRGSLYDIATPVTLHQGWNWIGVPLYSATTIETCLRDYLPTEGDALIGQHAFATYEDGTWAGTLTSLSPGQAYLMRVGQPQQFCWNSLSVARSGSKRYAPVREEEEAPWTCNPRAYPDVMAVVASLQVDGESVDNSAYTLGVFSGEECRGVAQMVDGLWYLSVHGNGSEPLTFRVLDASGEQFQAHETLEFTAQSVCGSRLRPMVISVGEQDGIQSLSPSSPVRAVVCYNLRGQRIATPASGIFIQETLYEDGRKVTRKLVR